MQGIHANRRRPNLKRLLFPHQTFPTCLICAGDDLRTSYPVSNSEQRTSYLPSHPLDEVCQGLNEQYPSESPAATRQRPIIVHPTTSFLTHRLLPSTIPRQGQSHAPSPRRISQYSSKIWSVTIPGNDRHRSTSLESWVVRSSVEERGGPLRDIARLHLSLCLDFSLDPSDLLRLVFFPSRSWIKLTRAVAT